MLPSTRMLVVGLGNASPRPRTHEVVSEAVTLTTPGSGRSREVAALATLLGALGAAATLALLAAGQTKLVYTLGIAGAVTAGVVGAVKILSEGDR